MVRINGKNITMTRGDSFHAVIQLWNPDGTPFFPASGDTILFAAKRNYDDDEPCIQTSVPHDTMTVDLDPADTADLDLGKYVWEMKLVTADGDVDTFIDKGTLRLDNDVILIEDDNEEA